MFFLNLNKITISFFYLSFYSYLAFSIPIFSLVVILLALNWYFKYCNFKNFK